MEDSFLTAPVDGHTEDPQKAKMDPDPSPFETKSEEGDSSLTELDNVFVPEKESDEEDKVEEIKTGSADAKTRRNKRLLDGKSKEALKNKFNLEIKHAKSMKDALKSRGKQVNDLD